MKNVRIWFKKEGLSRFISHLDLNKVMTLALNRSKIPVWHTEGFNPHPFLTFALPLSLGVNGLSETMDIKLEDESYDISSIPDKLNSALPDGIRAYRAAQPKMKPSQISKASYVLRIGSATQDVHEIYGNFRKMLGSSSIITTKKTKRGQKDIDLKLYLNDYDVGIDGDEVIFSVTLPAGSTENINPTLYLNAFKVLTGADYYFYTSRTSIMDRDGNCFE